MYILRSIKSSIVVWFTIDLLQADGVRAHRQTVFGKKRFGFLPGCEGLRVSATRRVKVPAALLYFLKKQRTKDDSKHGFSLPFRLGFVNARYVGLSQRRAGGLARCRRVQVVFGLLASLRFECFGVADHSGANRFECGGFVKVVGRLLVLGGFERGEVIARLLGKYGCGVAPTAQHLALRDSQKLHLAAAMTERNVRGFALHRLLALRAGYVRVKCLVDGVARDCPGH